MANKQDTDISRLRKLFGSHKNAAIIEIGKHIGERGNIVCIELKHKWAVHYKGEGGESCSSFYSGIRLNECNHIEVKLTNGVCIPQKRLDVKHIEDILSIIEFELTHYEKSKK